MEHWLITMRIAQTENLSIDEKVLMGLSGLWKKGMFATRKGFFYNNQRPTSLISNSRPPLIWSKRNQNCTYYHCFYLLTDGISVPRPKLGLSL